MTAFLTFKNVMIIMLSDCNDNDPTINPNSPEVCDGLDNDCNGHADDGLPKNSYYRDSDGDGYGDAGVQADTCISVPPTGFVANSLDCNDSDANFNPDMAETCDGLDNDCNGLADDGLPRNTYYMDVDGDSFGNINIPMDTCLSVPPVGFVVSSTDCDDNNGNINPSMMDISDNNIDDDCSGYDLYLITKVFPNPVQDMVEVHYDFTGEVEMNIVASDGRLVRTETVIFENNFTTISIGDLPAGVYAFRFINTGGDGELYFAEKIIKMN